VAVNHHTISMISFSYW